MMYIYIYYIKRLITDMCVTYISYEYASIHKLYSYLWTNDGLITYINLKKNITYDISLWVL